jgi:hypothetical protein
LLAHGKDEFADGIFLRLGAGTRLEVAEEVGLRAAEVVAEDAERACGIAESLRDQLGRDALHKVGAESLVLALRGGGGLEEEAGLLC